jgi:DMSO/TMAO reductase YedYZ heme-binding membrane subunit
MSVLARVVAWILSLAALVTSIEAIIRLVKFAWSLVIRLSQVFRMSPRLWNRFAVS